MVTAVYDPCWQINIEVDVKQYGTLHVGNKDGSQKQGTSCEAK